MVGGATHSRVGRDMAWSFVKDKWDEFYKRYPGGFLQARLVKFATEGFASEDMVRKQSDAVGLLPSCLFGENRSTEE